MPNVRLSFLAIFYRFFLYSLILIFPCSSLLQDILNGAWIFHDEIVLFVSLYAYQINMY